MRCMMKYMKKIFSISFCAYRILLNLKIFCLAFACFGTCFQANAASDSKGSSNVQEPKALDEDGHSGRRWVLITTAQDRTTYVDTNSVTANQYNRSVFVMHNRPSDKDGERSFLRKYLINCADNKFVIAEEAAYSKLFLAGRRIYSKTFPDVVPSESALKDSTAEAYIRISCSKAVEIVSVPPSSLGKEPVREALTTEEGEKIKTAETLERKGAVRIDKAKGLDINSNKPSQEDKKKASSTKIDGEAQESKIAKQQCSGIGCTQELRNSVSLETESKEVKTTEKSRHQQSVPSTSDNFGKREKVIHKYDSLLKRVNRVLPKKDAEAIFFDSSTDSLRVHVACNSAYRIYREMLPQMAEEVKRYGFANATDVQGFMDGFNTQLGRYINSIGGLEIYLKKVEPFNADISVIFLTEVNSDGKGSVIFEKVFTWMVSCNGLTASLKRQKDINE
jgi:hypothetical protein